MMELGISRRMSEVRLIPESTLDRFSADVSLYDLTHLQKSIVQRWLSDHYQFRLAVREDCRCESFSSTTELFVDNSKPYLVAGDLNADGEADTAMILINTFSNKASLVVFNGPLQEDMKEAFLADDIGITAKSLLFYDSTANKLFVGAAVGGVEKSLALC